MAEVIIRATKKEAQALARGKHTRGCAYLSPYSGGAYRCTCGWVDAKKRVRDTLRDVGA
jgi:hypothetical protein